MNEIHPLVLATIENERARRELELERLRSAREACVTSSAGGQSRVLALGKKIRQVEQITASWRLVLATVLDDDPRGEACPHDCDSCHDADCPCPRMGCAGDPDREDGDDVVTDFGAMVRASGRETEALRVVGSKSPRLGKIRCIRCTAEHRARLGYDSTVVDVTSEDLPDGGMCSDCHADVLA